ncbi:hypothetical protein IMAU30156_02025 [Lactobacillus helveticus]|nr:hypothetical protein [Lactobacillus helveticus]
MFKSTKSQFAIRKLTQGAVAVLLTFGIFANTTSGIVSAAVNESSDVNTTQIENNASTQNSIEAEFPTEQSLDTFIGIQAMSYNDRYFNRIHKGFGQVQDTLESYFD